MTPGTATAGVDSRQPPVGKLFGNETPPPAIGFEVPSPFPNDGEYVSEGLERIYPDSAFPHMTLGNTDTCGWAHLRRGFGHNWYVDERHTGIGFLSRDEAHILYNTALAFKGQAALEIGCWMGWSACHLALGGVQLDVVDPMLDHEVVGPSVRESLTAAGVIGRVNLYGGYSPGKVEELADAENRRWSLIFIDGDHEGRAPVEDAIICDRYAAEDALVLLHDLASPDVAAALDWLQDRGWNTMVYHTMQIMGVAWRGKTRPVAHALDPRVRAELPAHLRRHPLSGGRTAGSPEYARANARRSVATLNVTTPQGRKTVMLELDPSDPLHGRMLEPFSSGQLYAPAVANMIAASLLPGSTFVELGTGVGYFSILAALRVGDAGRVIAIPDSHRNTGALAANLSRTAMPGLSLLRLPREIAAGSVEAVDAVLARIEAVVAATGGQPPRSVMIGNAPGEAAAEDLAAAVIDRWGTPVLILRRQNTDTSFREVLERGYDLRSTAAAGSDCWDLFTRSA